jgi:GT2 family glycosyltransferase
MNDKIGIAITSYNNISQLTHCLDALSMIKNINIHVEIIDDGSTDDTYDIVKNNYPDFYINKGTGQLWWTGGTNAALKRCLENGCSYILLVNADVIVQENALRQLCTTAEKTYPSVVASVAVRADDPEKIWWAGSTWGKLIRGLPIWTSRYLYKKGTSINKLPGTYFETSEAHGRGVLFPKVVFDTVGLFDEKIFQHYGADADFSFRVREQGYKIYVEPRAIVLVDVFNTGLQNIQHKKEDALKEYLNYLLKRKNGEALRVWWYLTKRHLKFPDWVCTYLFVLLLNSVKFWHRKLFNKKT